MDIWLIQTGEPVPLDDKTRKMRTAILADKLIERGHNVIWWVSAFDHFKKDWIFNKSTEIKLGNGLRIKVLKGIGYRANFSLPRFIDHRIIAWKFRKTAPKMSKPDIIVASTPPYDLAYEAVMFAKRKNIPVVVDIRDEWPDLLISQLPSNLSKFAKTFLFQDFRMIKILTGKATALVSMMNSLLEWGLSYAKREKASNDRVFYLGSKKNPDNGTKDEDLGCLEGVKNKFIVTFIGAFVKNNHPSIIIECAKRLRGKGIHFVLAGDGELWQAAKEKSNGSANISLPGWLNQAEVSTLLKYSKVGIVPTYLIRNAFPNKVFSYLSAGLPVISAFQGDLKEIIEKYQIGFYYPPNDVDALTSCINKLYQDKELYAKMSANAKKVFDEMFDADKIYQEHAEHIERVAALC